MIVKRRRRECDVELEQSLPAKKPTIRPKLKMVVGATYYPKPNPYRPEGEDAYFICADQQTLGLADGVGGWARRGIDAGQYARDLMRNAALCILRQPEGADVNPRKLLQHAFANTKSKGSCTACIATLTQKETLQAVNVGDSGFMVFRRNELLFRSPTQQRGFNKPYQLGRSKKSDKPECCMEFEIAVEAGDVVVFGTDGVFDNVYGSEIERYMGLKVDGERVEAEELAWVIAEVALCNSRNRCARSPFAEAARKAGSDHVGGKVDDITVLVAYILPC